MNLSMKWLSQFVTTSENPRDFAEAMTMSGSKVEGYEIEGNEINNVVVGKVLEIADHPDSDHLVVCQIDIGKPEPIQIVTGANNLALGDLVPVALDGSTLPGGVKIKKGNLRGIESNGMMCGLSELGLTVNDFPYAIENGIFVLEEDCKPGDDFCDSVGFNDTKVEFEITSNRPDCLSVIGLAREVAATYNKPLTLHTPVIKTVPGSLQEKLSVTVLEPELCSFYGACMIENIKIKPSPRWMRERLRAMGVRPINNIVDITNYVMLEYGQPMHAFDYRFLEGRKIEVRKAKPGETITTLDDTQRALTEHNLIIADAKKPIAIAGVMGSEFSAVTGDTTTIVLESACFDGASVRMTARDFGMRTDASSRCEKGLDPNSCILALDRACELIELLCAGDVLDDVIIIDNITSKPVTILLDPDWVNGFLSTNLTEDEMKSILMKLDCKFDGNMILVPSFRSDLQHKADIAEEIARFYGYNNVVSAKLPGGAEGKYSGRQLFDRKITETMLALGLSEIMTYSFISPKYYDKIAMPKDHVLRTSVTISNPLGEETSAMRTTVLPSMMEILSKNYNNRNGDAALFELASEYHPVDGQELPDESATLVAGLYGKKRDFFTAKGIVATLFAKLGVKDYEIVAKHDAFSYHPGRCASILIGDKEIGVIGEIHPTVAENYGINEVVLSFSVSIDALFAHAQTEKTYTPLPKFPAVTRDLALVCHADIPVARLQSAMVLGAGKLLETIEVFDVYQGTQIEEGKKSVAFKLVLRSTESTLDEAQIAAAMKRTMKELEKVGATLRI